jgi:hypothetical protein
MSQFIYIKEINGVKDLTCVTSKKYYSELHEIGFKYGTDKCYINPDEKSYLHHYEDIMKDKRDREINLLEIGVRDGPCLYLFL